MFGRRLMLCSFWNSRSRLLRISVCLTLLNISLSIFRDFLDEPTEAKFKTDSRNGGDFDEDMDYVLETIQYMHDLKIGKAEIRPVVEEVLAMSFRSVPQNQKIFCNLYDMDRERYCVVEGTIREIWQRAWDPRELFYIPNLISCPVPEYFEHSTHLTVALSKTACASQKATAQVRKTAPARQKQGIAKRRHELIPYNDCLYRHIDTHKYVLILDVDEVIVPLKHDNWSAMLEEVIATAKSSTDSKLAEITSVSIRNVFKFPSNNSINHSVPDYVYMLRNRRKSETISEPGEYGKATDTVSTVFNHFALHRQHGNVRKTLYVNPDVALKLHYKEKCPIESGRQCEQLERVTVDDTSMDKYAEELTQRVTRVLKILKFIN
ncbi:unnamed protein product [Gongylonema pulchrum]|uniref:Glycosyltransferase family 92 protein n=1 Tax=Gongylonema pulchrum TaxID=637853 RepID=A0A183E557_9BILA|nr:unnamed protein product [Gongylonema pulchrum]